jgi:hypothetical protein
VTDPVARIVADMPPEEQDRLIRERDRRRQDEQDAIGLTSRQGGCLLALAGLLVAVVAAWWARR